MKNPLQSLLILFALGLCGLCTWQWYGQMLQQKRMNALAQTNYDQEVKIQGYIRSVKNMDDQIAQMDAHLTELKDAVNGDKDVISRLREDNRRLTGSVEQYSKAVAELQDRLKQANDLLKRLAQERDEYAGRLNQSIEEHNEIVTKYNALVKQFEATQKERNDIVAQYNALAKQFEALQAAQSAK
jgi:chromosome segregation ATPase